MNIKNLQAVITVLKETLPEDFDMYERHNLDTGKKCILGLTIDILLKGDDDQEKVNKFLGMEPLTNEWYYLFGAIWGLYPSINTIDHAIYRIEKLISGYHPEHIYSEVLKERKEV